MDKIIIGSTRKNSGKTSFVVGLAKTIGKNFAYIKPFGDRLYYRKKRLWDYDSALITSIFNLEDSPEDMSIGFDHTKVRYMYTEETMKEKLNELIDEKGKDKDIVFIEGAEHLSYGAFVHLDAMSVARAVSGKLILVVSGEEGAIMDDLTFIKNYMSVSDIDFKGVVINKVQDIDDFSETYLSTIKEMGIPVIGMLPYRPQLTHLTVSNLAERLFSKVIAGENGLGKTIKNIFIGAMNADAALNNPMFKKEDKLIITSGDRGDMIVASLESSTSCIVLTNNIVPTSQIISKAAAANIPLLLVSEDTYEIVKQIERIEPLLTKAVSAKIDLLEEMVSAYIDVEKVL